MGTQFPFEDEERRETQDDEEAHQNDDVDPVEGVTHVELFEELDGRFVVAVGLRTVQIGTVVAVDSQQRAFEAVAHVCHVRQPAQVRRDGVERHEEAGEEQDRNGGYRSQVYGRLNE